MNREQLGKVREFISPSRRALSLRFPVLAPVILAARRSLRSVSVVLDRSVASEHSAESLPCVVTRHSSLLMRKLGSTDMRLQRQKVENLRIAAAALDGLIIRPGEVFSFWDAVGAPTYGRGYVDGMLLSAGKVSEGVGGGLCQMSNLLHWAFLHAPFEVTERMHHSFDVFPDSGRTIPFGSGATIFYNLIDLRARNISTTPIQIRVWLTENDLKLQLRSAERISEKYHVYEKEHAFVRAEGTWFRSNELWRQTLVDGQIVRDEKLYDNFAPVMYPVTQEYLVEHGFTARVYERNALQ